MGVECLFCKSEKGCCFGDKDSYAHRQVDEQLSMRSPKKWKSSNMQRPIRCVRFTEAVVRHADIRDQNPSLGMICPVILISETPMLHNLRIGLRKRRNGKSDVPAKQRGSWPKNILKYKRKHSNILLAFGKLVPACINS